MREIKFRAWDTDKERMIQGRDGMIAHKSVIHCINNKPNPNKRGTWMSELGYMCNGILMQYTGLKDKNGKEIYEGDIVEVKHRNHVVEIRFEGGCFRGLDYNEKTKVLLEIFNEECEIIRNIYEKPELLEEKKEEEFVPPHPTKVNPTDV